METGIIKFFKNGSGKGQGYGFISCESGGEDLFVHISQLRGADSPGEKALYPGDRVSFEINRNPKGKLEAVNVRVQLRADEPAQTRSRE